jgi:hypothetical protein
MNTASFAGAGLAGLLAIFVDTRTWVYAYAWWNGFVGIAVKSPKIIAQSNSLKPRSRMIVAADEAFGPHVAWRLF